MPSHSRDLRESLFGILFDRKRKHMACYMIFSSRNYTECNAFAECGNQYRSHRRTKSNHFKYRKFQCLLFVMEKKLTDERKTDEDWTNGSTSFAVSFRFKSDKNQQVKAIGSNQSAASHRNSNIVSQLC